jgi:hypothetical protein
MYRALEVGLQADTCAHRCYAGEAERCSYGRARPSVPAAAAAAADAAAAAEGQQPTPLNV